MGCLAHKNHDHTHTEDCGHTRIKHGDHIDYVHDGHLHREHGDHYDECKIEVDEKNPAQCKPIACDVDHQAAGHEKIPHGDHVDYLVDGRLHCPHGDHCDDHGPVEVLG